MYIIYTKMGKHFDCVLINPPYGTVGGDVIHLKFVDKCLDISDKQIAIFPFGFVTKLHNKVQNKYKEKFNKYLTSIEEVDSKEFSGTSMPNPAIYEFNVNKKQNEKIIIKRLNQDDKEEINSLLDISEFNDYESEIIKYLKEHGQQLGVWCGGVTKRQSELNEISPDKHKEFLDNKIISNCEKVNNYIKNGYVALTVINSNGGMNGKAISSKTGNIFDDKNKLIKYYLNLRVSAGHNALLFKSIKSAENCKIALQNPLLRFTIYRTQDDQNVTYNKCYKYVPNINWEDDRVKTDKGLLEVCGCPKDKCKEYADYCKKIIEEVDKKK